MMKKTELLILASGKENLNALIKLTSSHTDWNKTSSLTDEDAIEKFHTRKFDVAIIDTSLQEESYRKLKTIFERQNPQTVILNYTKNTQQLVQDILRINGQLSKPKNAFFIDPKIYQSICLN